METPNYGFPLYAYDDSPDLTGNYNEAVSLIDIAVKEAEDIAIEAAADAAGVETKLVLEGEDLTVDMLANARINDYGMLYFKEEN